MTHPYYPEEKCKMLCRLGLHKFMKISVYLRKCMKCGRIEYWTIDNRWIDVEDLKGDGR